LQELFGFQGQFPTQIVVISTTYNSRFNILSVVNFFQIKRREKNKIDATVRTTFEIF